MILAMISPHRNCRFETAPPACRRTEQNPPPVPRAWPAPVFYNRAMPIAALVLFASAAALGAPDEQLTRALARVSEEAEVFRTLAPKTVADETLVQRVRKPRRRFRPRPGVTGLEPPKPEYRTRELVSVYGFSTLQDSPMVPREFRQVVSVDGRRVTGEAEARQALVRGLRSEDDRLKARMLATFEKRGLTGGEVDFGQVILLFTRQRLDDYSFHYTGPGQIGAEAASVFDFEQRGGAASLLVVEKRNAEHLPLRGQLWVRSLRFAAAPDRAELGLERGPNLDSRRNNRRLHDEPAWPRGARGGG